MSLQHLTPELLLRLKNNPDAPKQCLGVLVSPQASTNCVPCGANKKESAPAASALNEAKRCIVAMSDADKARLLAAIGASEISVTYFDAQSRPMRHTITKKQP